MPAEHTMLTLRQLFAISGQSSGAGLLDSARLSPLSIASVIRAYEQQRCAYFVNLVSPSILLSNQVDSVSDLIKLAPGSLGQMGQAELTALSTALASQGVYLRYVNKDLRTAALIGTVGSLQSVPAITVNDQNFTTIKDYVHGVEVGGEGTAILGAAILGAGVGLENPIMAFIGGVVLGLGVGAMIGGAAIEIKEDYSPGPPKSSSDTTDVPNDTGDGDSGDIEVPAAVSVGSAANGIDVDTVINTLATATLDAALGDFPIGWDSGSGVGPPGIGDGSLGVGGDGSGGGGAGGFDLPGV